MRRSVRRSVRFAAGVVMAALAPVACSSGGDDGATPSSTASTSTSTTSATGSGSGSGSGGPTSTFVTVGGQGEEPPWDLAPSVIVAEAETDIDGLWDLVDADGIVWNQREGYTFPMEAGTSLPVAMDICRSVAEVLDDRDLQDGIAITDGDARGEPIALREPATFDCRAA